MPCFHQMVNPFAPNQGTGENRAKLCRPFSGNEPINIHAAGQIKQFVFGEALHSKCVGCHLREHDQQVSQFVLFDKTLALQQQAGFPFLPPRRVRLGFRWLLGFYFQTIAMPGGDLHNRRDIQLFGHPKRSQTIARPTVKQVVAARSQMPRHDPVQILLFRSVILWPLHKRDEPHRMPAQRMNESCWNFLLAVVISDRFAEESTAV